MTAPAGCGSSSAACPATAGTCPRPAAISMSASAAWREAQGQGRRDRAALAAAAGEARQIAAWSPTRTWDSRRLHLLCPRQEGCDAPRRRLSGRRCRGPRHDRSGGRHRARRAVGHRRGGSHRGRRGAIVRGYRPALRAGNARGAWRLAAADRPWPRRTRSQPAVKLAGTAAKIPIGRASAAACPAGRWEYAVCAAAFLSARPVAATTSLGIQSGPMLLSYRRDLGTRRRCR